MRSLDITVLESALGWLQQQRSIWLCTVLHTWGSAPRAPGALLAASDAGAVSGSLSGGCIEESFQRRLAAGEFRQPSQRVRYGAGGLQPDISLPCGGSLEVLIEYLPPSAAAERYLAQLLSAQRGECSLQKRVVTGQFARLTPCEKATPQSEIRFDDQQVSLKLFGSTTLLIAGLSPVADYCIHLAQMLGYAVVLCEHREQPLAAFLANSTLSDGVTVIKQFPARYLEQHQCAAHTAILCLTHDARIDDLTLMEACRGAAFYIGALGSPRNSMHRLARLAACGDLTKEQLARIAAPVGLPIGSKTPPEIALAIMADIVRVKNGR
jgi:xanthine dehydrogenase accessory factor